MEDVQAYQREATQVSWDWRRIDWCYGCRCRVWPSISVPL